MRRGAPIGPVPARRPSLRDLSRLKGQRLDPEGWGSETTRDLHLHAERRRPHQGDGRAKGENRELVAAGGPGEVQLPFGIWPGERLRSGLPAGRIRHWWW